MCQRLPQALTLALSFVHLHVTLFPKLRSHPIGKLLEGSDGFHQVKSSWQSVACQPLHLAPPKQPALLLSLLLSFPGALCELRLWNADLPPMCRASPPLPDILPTVPDSDPFPGPPPVYLEEHLLWALRSRYTWWLRRGCERLGRKSGV